MRWSLLPALCSLLLGTACKSGTPVTATQAVLDSADQVLLGMSHYVTELGVLRARARRHRVLLLELAAGRVAQRARDVLRPDRPAHLDTDVQRGDPQLAHRRHASA